VRVRAQGGPGGGAGRPGRPHFGWALGLAALGALLASASTRASLSPAQLASALDSSPTPAHFFVARSPSRVVPIRPDTAFRHSNHTSVSCVSCHSMDPTHGQVRVRTLADCRSCHHASEPARDCVTCHSRSDAPAEPLSLSRALTLSVGLARERTLPFAHASHAALPCGRCHTEGLALSAASATCTGCHVEHHRPEARCASCHVPVREPPHEVQVHVGCTGSGCHAPLPFQEMPRARAACVVCHLEQEEHRPERECVACHLLPPARRPWTGG
jgi:hypothetical protein